jgi:hypothetical protein
MAVGWAEADARANAAIARNTVHSIRFPLRQHHCCAPINDRKKAVVTCRA